MRLTSRRFNIATINFLSFLVVLSALLLFTPSASLGQVLSLSGCLDNNVSCDTELSTPNVIQVSNFDIGQDFSLSGELTYFPLVSPGGGISSALPAIGGVRFTNGSITYSATATGPVTTEFDFAFFEPSSTLLQSSTYTTIATYSGSINATTALGSRAFTLRTIANTTGNLPSAVATPSAGGPLVTLITGAGIATTSSYNVPTSGTEAISLVVGVTAFPGDVFTFPNSIEVGLFSVPEPTSLVLASLCLMSVYCIRRRRI